MKVLLIKFGSRNGKLVVKVNTGWINSMTQRTIMRHNPLSCIFHKVT